jgi:hypothetical protein
MFEVMLPPSLKFRLPVTFRLKLLRGTRVQKRVAGRREGANAEGMGRESASRSEEGDRTTRGTNVSVFISIVVGAVRIGHWLSRVQLWRLAGRISFEWYR